MTNELKINDTIPTFVLPLSDDTLLDSKELKKKLYIIYFYPKDNTPGCTNEAKDFSSNIEKFKKNKVEVVGVSKDSIKSHEKFIIKNGLKIPLLSDSENEICEAFGVWTEKSMYGKTYL